MTSNSHAALKEYIDSIWVVDTHEHLTSEDDLLAMDERRIDFTRFFTHYASVDVVSSGMPDAEFGKVMNPDTPLEEKWTLFEPFWEKARTTAYCKAVDTAIRDLFDLPGLSRDTYQPLAQKMREMRKQGYYRWVLKDKARIALSILDTGMLRPNTEFFAAVANFDRFVMVRTRDELKGLENETQTSIYSVDDLVSTLQKTFKQNFDMGIVGAKSPLAYVRTLYFEYPSKSDAENAFSRIFTERGQYRNDGAHGIPAGEGKALQDYMFHKVIQCCIEHNLPMQIHTGIQEGNGNYLAQTNPVLLNEVFMRYPRQRFDIFHAGYPYWAELGVLAKMFPGVHADLCWTNVISPAASRRALDEWLEVIPGNKIFAFGGDYIFVEGAYAHAKFARKNVARVLAGKVDEDYFTLDEAKRVADMVLRENAQEFFRLKLV